MAAETDHSNYVDDEEIQRGGGDAHTNTNQHHCCGLHQNTAKLSSINFIFSSQRSNSEAVPVHCRNKHHKHQPQTSSKEILQRVFSSQMGGWGKRVSNGGGRGGERVLWTSGTKTLFTCASIYFSSLMCLSGFTQFRENVCNSNFVFALWNWLTFLNHQYIWKCVDQLNYVYVKFTYSSFKSEKITPLKKIASFAFARGFIHVNHVKFITTAVIPARCRHHHHASCVFSLQIDFKRRMNTCPCVVFLILSAVLYRFLSSCFSLMYLHSCRRNKLVSVPVWMLRRIFYFSSTAEQTEDLGDLISLKKGATLVKLCLQWKYSKSGRDNSKTF